MKTRFSSALLGASFLAAASVSAAVPPSLVSTRRFEQVVPGQKGVDCSIGAGHSQDAGGSVQNAAKDGEAGNAEPAAQMQQGAQKVAQADAGAATAKGQVQQT